jgi:hypothetical protein
LLPKEKCLLVVNDNQKYISVYLEGIVGMDGALKRDRGYKKRIPVEKVGVDVLISYDETKRMLAVCGSTKVRAYHSGLV